jgi:hypothetical protein
MARQGRRATLCGLPGMAGHTSNTGQWPAREGGPLLQVPFCPVPRGFFLRDRFASATALATASWATINPADCCGLIANALNCMPFANDIASQRLPTAGPARVVSQTPYAHR